MIVKQVSEIMELAVDITMNSKVDVFVYFSAHTTELRVDIFLDGWHKQEGIGSQKHAVFLDRDWSNPKEEVPKMIARLESLKGDLHGTSSD